MKGGLAAALVALAALRGTRLSGPVELAAVMDEEETGKGIRAYVADTQRSFVGCITAEPTDLQTIIAARGDSYLRVAVHGRACHAGNPADGANAIYGAAAVVAEIERLHAMLAADPHPLLGPATWSVGQINGGTGGSIVPAECVIVADRRLLPGESPAAVLDDLRHHVAALRLEDRGLTVDLDMPMEMPAFETAADTDLVRITEAARVDAGGPELPLGRLDRGLRRRVRRPRSRRTRRRPRPRLRHHAGSPRGRIRGDPRARRRLPARTPSPPCAS